MSSPRPRRRSRGWSAADLERLRSARYGRALVYGSAGGEMPGAVGARSSIRGRSDEIVRLAGKRMLLEGLQELAAIRRGYEAQWRESAAWARSPAAERPYPRPEFREELASRWDRCAAESAREAVRYERLLERVQSEGDPLEILS